MDNFWARLPVPFFVLAPMEDVTDVAFRTLIARTASSSVSRVLYTEFTSADGLVRADTHGRAKLLKKLAYGDGEHPIVAQLFSSTPAYMEEAARTVAALGFDGVDINMGCPDRAVEKQGSGAALIKNPRLATELIAAARRGAGGLPVSVKTRVGYSHEEIDTWITSVLEEKPAALAVHLRTRKELSEVPAHWEWMSRIVLLRDDISPATRIIGNGDVRDLANARAKARETGCDGVMLGRAVFGNPWIFADRTVAPTPRERVKALIEHAELFREHLSGTVSEAVMKRHFKAYIHGWRGAAELRAQLMQAPSLHAAVNILKESIDRVAQ